jgi:hypothetical protein
MIINCDIGSPACAAQHIKQVKDWWKFNEQIPKALRHDADPARDDFSEAFPAFLTLVATPLTFSIATGLSLGLLSFTFIKVGTGKHREISPLIWILSLLFLLRYAFLGWE